MDLPIDQAEVDKLIDGAISELAPHAPPWLRDDLRQAAREAALERVEKPIPIDPATGRSYAMATHLRPAIKGAINKELGKQSGLVKGPRGDTSHRRRMIPATSLDTG